MLAEIDQISFLYPRRLLFPDVFDLLATDHYSKIQVANEFRQILDAFPDVHFDVSHIPNTPILITETEETAERKAMHRNAVYVVTIARSDAVRIRFLIEHAHRREEVCLDENERELIVPYVELFGVIVNRQVKKSTNKL